MEEIVIKKKIRQILFFLIVIGLTLYGVFKGEDINELMRDVSEAKWTWLLLCVGLVVVYIGCESYIIRLLLSKLHIKLRKREAFLISGVGFFFSGVTPSASGGQPAQVVYMRKCGINVSEATNVLMWVTVLYKMVLVVIGLLLIIFRRDYITNHMDDRSWLFYLGIILNMIFIGFLVLLWLKSHWLERVGDHWIAVAAKFHLIKNKQNVVEKWQRFIDGHNASFVAMKGQTKTIVFAFIITFIQRMVLFSITGFVCLAFGISRLLFWKALLLQAMISVSVDMLPLPGGSGISEHLFELMFLSIFGADLVLPGMVMSRGIAYYVQLLLCGVMTIVAHTYFSEKEKRIKKKESKVVDY